MRLDIIVLSIAVKLGFCRDFYIGMFKPNDHLVADDYIFKGAAPHSFAFAKYGRYFSCPITYFRIVDRLGMGRGPTVKIVRGGLRKRYIVVRIKSPYNQPISTNIYVGCENKQTKYTTQTILTTKKLGDKKDDEDNEVDKNTDKGEETKDVDDTNKGEEKKDGDDTNTGAGDKDTGEGEDKKDENDTNNAANSTASTKSEDT